MSESIYLDYNGSTPMDEEVRAAVTMAMEIFWENPSSRRGGGPACKDAIESARHLLATMINATPDEIIFTSGGTESNNLVFYSAIEAYHQFRAEKSVRPNVEDDRTLDKVPHIITTNVEHDSISLLLKHLESKRLCRVTTVPVEPMTGAVSMFAMTEAVVPSTCLVSMMSANNETGVLQPVSDVGTFLKELNVKRAEKTLPIIRLHTDAAQAIGKVPVDVNNGGGVDFLTIVGHKFGGPRIGALYVRRGAPIYPLLFGGGQEKSIRPGTENTPMIVGLGKAAEQVIKNRPLYTAVMQEMRNYLELRLSETFGNDILLNYAKMQEERLPNTSSVTFKCLKISAATLLESCVRLVASTGASCHAGRKKPSPILVACGISPTAAMQTIRFSVGRQTTRREIDDAVKELSELVSRLDEEDKCKK